MLSYELREKIFQCVNHDIDIEQLEDWLVPRLPIFLKSLDTTDAQVVDTIELNLAEISDGITTEYEFRKLLEDILQEHSTTQLSYPEDQPQNDTSGSLNPTLWDTRRIVNSISPVMVETVNATPC